MEDKIVQTVIEPIRSVLRWVLQNMVRQWREKI